MPQAGVRGIAATKTAAPRSHAGAARSLGQAGRHALPRAFQRKWGVGIRRTLLGGPNLVAGVAVLTRPARGGVSDANERPLSSRR